MLNISQVKKYEQVLTFLNFPFKLTITLFLAILVICSTFTAYGKNESAKEQVGEGARGRTGEGARGRTGEGAKELSLEISEKYYKKEAILKFNEAVKNWEAKNTDSAITLFKEALNLDPNLWVSYLGLGQAYESKKEYKNSLEAYSQYLKIAPKAADDRKSIQEVVKYLTHLLRYGEEAIKSEDYLALVKTKHQGKEQYVRWELSLPLKIYFYPAEGVPNYKKEFQNAFLEGAMVWQEALPNLKFEIIDNSILSKLSSKEKTKKEKELIDQAQIKVIFPSRFKVKGDPNNPLVSQIDAQSFPIIRDKKNFRVLGVIMVSPYIYYQSQIAIPLEPLSKLKPEDQIKKLKMISAREAGHALGLWGFSPNPDDLMFEGDIEATRDLPLLSERDKNTIKKLYELDAEKEEIVTNK